LLKTNEKEEIFMEKEIENSQVEQLEDTFYIKHRGKSVKEGIKKIKKFWKSNRKTILVVTVTGIGFLAFKMSVLAEGNAMVPRDDKSLLKRPPQTSYEKGKALVTTVLGLKVFYDPTASKAKKYSAAGRLICCTSAIATGALTEIMPSSTVAKKLLAACCTASWAAYTYFIPMSADKNE
jgi:hypothetical protein